MNQMLADTPTLEHPEARTLDLAASSKRPPRIGVWGHYGGANQGDELVVTTLITNIRARIPDAEIVGFCMNPPDSEQRHGIRAFPIRASARGGQPEKPWSAAEAERKRVAACYQSKSRLRAFLKRWRLLVSLVRGVRNGIQKVASVFRELSSLVDSYRDLRGTDLLIVAGSGPLFDDWAGAWAQPYAMYKWSALARLCGTRFVCLSVGAGPIDSRLSRTFLRRAVRTTWYRSYRDLNSAKLIASLGVEGEHPVFPDMGLGLDVACYVRPWDLPSAARNRTIVGLGVMAYRDPRYMPKHDPSRYTAYIQKMAELTAWLLRNDYAVLVVPLDIRFDPQAFADIREVLSREHGIDDDPRLIEFERPVDGLTALASLISSCDYVISARYHGIILPWLLGKPVVALVYNQKHIDLMESMGQQEYFLDIDRFEVSELVERFQALERDGDAIRARLPEYVALCRKRLAEQYDRVLGSPVAAH